MWELISFFHPILKVCLLLVFAPVQYTVTWCPDNLIVLSYSMHSFIGLEIIH